MKITFDMDTDAVRTDFYAREKAAYEERTARREKYNNYMRLSCVATALFILAWVVLAYLYGRGAVLLYVVYIIGLAVDRRYNDKLQRAIDEIEIPKSPNLLWLEACVKNHAFLILAGDGDDNLGIDTSVYAPELDKHMSLVCLTDEEASNAHIGYFDNNPKMNLVLWIPKDAHKAFLRNGGVLILQKGLSD